MHEPADTPSHPAEIRYGLTALGREALAETSLPERVVEPLRRIRRARSRVRALVRVARRNA